MFNFNGISAKDIPWLRVKDIKGSVLPPLRRRYVTIPGKEGAYHAGRDVGIRREVITIKVNGGSLEGLMEKRRFLADWLDTEETAPFFYDHEPTKVYRAVLSEETNLDQVIYYGEVDLIFEMPDPYAESVEKKTALLQGMSAGARYEDFTGVGTGTDIVADASGLRLAKEGRDYSNMVDTDWESGTHNGTTEVGNEFLQLARSGTDYDFLWDSEETWNDPSNTRVNTDGASTDLDMVGLPVWDLIDYMTNYRATGWVADGDPVISQHSGHVLIDGSAPVTRQTRIYRTHGMSFSSATFDFKASITGDYMKAWITNGTNAWRVYLPNTNGAVRWFRIRIIDTSTAELYVDGTLTATTIEYTTSTSQNIQFYIQNAGESSVMRIYFVFFAGTDLGPPPAGNWYDGVWETSYISLSQVGNVGLATLRWFYEYTYFNIDDSGISIDYQLKVDGIEQGWKTLFNDPTQEGEKIQEIPDLPKGTNVATTEIKLRVTLRTRSPFDFPYLDYLQITVKSGYLTSGHWDSPVITGIQQVGKAARSDVTWAVDFLPAGTSAKVYVRHRLNSADPWGDWLEVVNSGDPFPGIDQATDLSAAEIQYRVKLYTTDVAVTPSVDSLQLTFYTGYKPTGQWVSPQIPLEDANVVGDSIIFFTWNGIQDVQLEARINGGAWQPVENGGEIPGVRGAEGAVVEVRLTLSTADTSETPVINSLEVTAKEAIDSFIEYDGTAPGYPVFRIDVIDELDFIQILHVESGRYILLEGNFQPGDEIVIDHNAQSITLNGVYRLDLLNIKARFFRLQKGTNSFEVSPQYGAIISMEWAERWK